VGTDENENSVPRFFIGLLLVTLVLNKCTETSKKLTTGVMNSKVLLL